MEPDHDTGPEYVETYGPAVAELNARIGFAPDPQQEHCLDKIFGIREDGLSACFEYGCVVCRQNLKTGLFKQVAIGWLFVVEVPWFVWSAHEMSTTLESMNEIHTLIADSALSAMLPPTRNLGLYEDNNKTRIELRNGQRILFKARTMSGGRGLAAPKVILDEAFALRAAHVGSLLPALAAQEDPQVLYGSSAGKADSTILIDVRDRGRAHMSPRLGYDEWLAPYEPCQDDDCTHPKDAVRQGIDCALDRPHLRLRANPTVTTGRITMETLDGLRQALPPEEFLRECLGRWDEPAEGAGATFGPGRWEACAVDTAPPAAPAAIGLAISRDQLWGSIAAAQVVEVIDDDDPDAEPQTAVFMAPVDRRAETDWMVAEAKRIQDETDCMVLLDGGGPAKVLIPDLEEADVAFEVVSLAEYAQACDNVFKKVRSGALQHPDGTEMNDAVDGADWRYIGDIRVWGRKSSTGDVAMLEAGTLAVHGAEMTGAFTL